MIKIAHLMKKSHHNAMIMGRFNSLKETNNHYLIIGEKEVSTGEVHLKYDVEGVLKHITSDDDYTHLFIHSMSSEYHDLILKIPEHIDVYWFGWGADYYSMLAQTLPIIGENTKKFLRENLKFSLLKATSLKLCKKLLYPNSKNISSINPLSTKVQKVPNNSVLDRINKFSFISPEAELLSDLYSIPKEKFFYFPYQVLLDAPKSGATSLNILLGNSASPENNHIEAFEKLASLKCTNPVWVPLSYGSKKYAHKLTEVYSKKLKENFFPILEFLALEEYENLISNCEFFYMNHIRQQAYSTILQGLNNGKTVIMDERSPAFKYLTKVGFKIMKTVDMEVDSNGQLIPFNDEIKNLNAENCRNVFSENHQNENLLKILVGT